MKGTTWNEKLIVIGNSNILSGIGIVPNSEFGIGDKNDSVWKFTASCKKTVHSQSLSSIMENEVNVEKPYGIFCTGICLYVVIQNWRGHGQEERLPKIVTKSDKGRGGGH